MSVAASETAVSAEGAARGGNVDDERLFKFLIASFAVVILIFAGHLLSYGNRQIMGSQPNALHRETASTDSSVHPNDPLPLSAIISGYKDSSSALSSVRHSKIFLTVLFLPQVGLSKLVEAAKNIPSQLFETDPVTAASDMALTYDNILTTARALTISESRSIARTISLSADQTASAAAAIGNLREQFYAGHLSQFSD